MVLIEAFFSQTLAMRRCYLENFSAGAYKLSEYRIDSAHQERDAGIVLVHDGAEGGQTNQQSTGVECFC